ncbi:unnamed protein product, partial [Medioppia subpectinata]
MAQYYAKIKKYPPGPKPLPIFGNILMFWNYQTRGHWNHELIDLAKIYGPVFTIWGGPWPIIIVCDVDIAKEAFNKSDFSGRPPSDLGEIFSNENHTEIAFRDYDKTWEALRKVTHTAVIKYSRLDELSNCVNEVVGDTYDDIMSRYGANRPFPVKDYVFDLFCNVNALTTLSRKLRPEEIVKFKYTSDTFQTDLGNSLFLYEFLPIARKLMSYPLKKYRDYFDQELRFTSDQYETHVKTYNNDHKRNICDLIISGKQEAQSQGKDMATHLTDINMKATLIDMFLPTSDTTHTFLWILLYIAYYPEVQRRIRDEIECIVGDRSANPEDRHRLHYTMSYIWEMQRIRNSVPIGLFHSAVNDAKLGEYVVPKGTPVVVHQLSILTDEKYWDKPLEFKPDRFLDNEGKQITVKPAAFIPFSIGKRKCIGEQLATTTLMLTLAKESAQYLTDINITATLIDIIITATDNAHVFQWILLFVAYYPEVQRKLRQEISNELGDRPVTTEDKHRKYNLPEGTSVVVQQYSILMDEKYWDKPDEFNPSRFLDNVGKQVVVKPAAFIPFGVGRRQCIGEQLATNTLFLSLVRLLQLTTDYNITIDKPAADTLDADPINLWIQFPKQYNIVLKNLAKEAFAKVDFSGRPPSELGETFGNAEIAFSNYGKMWETLRKVGHSAMRYKLNKDQMDKFKYCFDGFQSDLGNWLFLYEFVPILRYFMANPLTKYKQYFNTIKGVLKDIYEKHAKTYDKENTNNFCDLLITAKHEAEAQAKGSAQYLTDDNLTATIMDVIMPGSDLNHQFQWILLFVAYYPEVQRKLRQEIANELGDRPVVTEDKHRMHYTMAYIWEIMRYKNIAPIGFFHLTIKDSKIGKYSIPAGTSVVVQQYSILLDEKYWDKPDEFNPGRFLDNEGKQVVVKPAAFIPFGVGRRQCIGEQLATNSLFLTL